jgi:hypothetical protein
MIATKVLPKTRLRKPEGCSVEVFVLLTSESILSIFEEHIICHKEKHAKSTKLSDRILDRRIRRECNTKVDLRGIVCENANWI